VSFGLKISLPVDGLVSGPDQPGKSERIHTLRRGVGEARRGSLLFLFLLFSIGVFISTIL
jgi:hypothetical protein